MKKKLMDGVITGVGIAVGAVVVGKCEPLANKVVDGALDLAGMVLNPVRETVADILNPKTDGKKKKKAA